ncbi:MAG: alkene reductase [Candidatus Cloacimonadota bacterium]|nr:MAG: alkene reductase [Candidatus Cloacimonadota bacterium]
MKNTKLFEKYKLSNELHLKNRIVMAPLTRCFANKQLMVTKDIAAYYKKRADAGLIISEATIIRADGQGYPNTPGIYTQDQIESWKLVTQAVHENDGKIFLQLWHCGRVSHSFYTNTQPVAPSALAVDDRVPRTKDLRYETPHELTKQEILQLIEDYKTAAKNAIEAGFDGVEIHGANGYLIDQFLHFDSNHRTDSYGSTKENMIKFPLEVVQAVCQEVGSQKVGLRLSPAAYFNMKNSPKDTEVFELLISKLNDFNLSYIHSGIFDDSVEYDFLNGTVTSFLRKHYKGTVIASGGYTPQKANQDISDNKMDLIAIGRPFIANPNLVELIKDDKNIVKYTESILLELV